MDTNSYWRQFEQSQDFWYHTITVLSILIGVLGLLLNSFVIHFHICSKRFKATSNRFLLLNLAVSDLLKVLFNIPLKVISSWAKEWIFGDFGCQFYGFVGGLSGFVGITTLAIMTIDRYLIIRTPLNVLKNRLAAILWSIVFSWIYSLICIGLQFLSDNGFVLEGMLTSCTFDYLSQDLKSRAIVIGLFVGGFFIPFASIVIFCILIVRLIRSKRRSLELALRIECKIQSCSLLDVDKDELLVKTKPLQKVDLDRTVIEVERHTGVGSFDLVYKTQQRRRNGLTNVLVKRERQVTKMVVACVAFFCLSWFPYAIVVIIGQIGVDVERYVTPIAATLPALFAKTSAIFNPLFFTIVNPDCKIHFRRLFGFKEKKTLETNAN